MNWHFGLIAVCLCFLSATRTACAELSLPSGYIYCIQRGGLWFIRLPTGQTGKLADLPARSSGLSKLDKSNLLVLSDEQTYSINLSSFQIKPLVAGTTATYLSASKHLLYSEIAREPNQSKINLVSIVSLASLKSISIEGIVQPLSLIVPISEETAVLSPDYRNSAKNGKVLRVNTNTLQIDTLPIDNCKPILWRTQSQQLLCIEAKSSSWWSNNLRYFFVNLDGSNVKFFDSPNGTAVTYIEQSDALLFSKATFRFSLDGDFDLIWYDLKTARSKKLAKDFGVGTQGAIFVSDEE